MVSNMQGMFNDNQQKKNIIRGKSFFADKENNEVAYFAKHTGRDKLGHTSTETVFVWRKKAVPTEIQTT